MPTHRTHSTILRMLALCATAAFTISTALALDYAPTTDPANIGLTPPAAPPTVIGQPRVAKGHPRTIWDTEDVARFRELLKTNKDFQLQFAALREALDKRLEEPFTLPDPQKGPDGKWLAPSEFWPEVPEFPTDDKQSRFRYRISRELPAIADFGIAYALTGEEKYGKRGKEMLMAYARNYARYGAHDKYNIRFGSGMITLTFVVGIHLSQTSFGYDLLATMPGWTAEEHKQVHSGLLRVMAGELIHPGAVEIAGQHGSPMMDPSNRGIHCAVGVLMAGYATADQELIDVALYGMIPTIEKNDNDLNKTFPPGQYWKAATKEAPTGGIIRNVIGRGIQDDGMWLEGSPAYAIYAGTSILVATEAAWRNGLDLYRHDNARLKNLFDFPLALGYPDLSTPALNDSGRSSLCWGSAPVLYEFGYLRYGDPRYLAFVNNPRHLEYLKYINGQLDPAPTPEEAAKLKSSRMLRVNKDIPPLPSPLFDLPPDRLAPPIMPRNVNFYIVGFGALATPGEVGPNRLILSYGPSAGPGHNHPDKLHIDLWALGDALLPSPGIDFPYHNNPRIANWYHTTISHNTLTVDEKVQEFDHRRGIADGHQLVYGPAATVGMQRAWTNTVYEGIAMDRSLFLTKNYLADLFLALSDTPRLYDLAWHIAGDTPDSPALKLAPRDDFPEDLVGYNTLKSLRHATTAEAYAIHSAPLGPIKGEARLFAAAAGAPTEVILAEGGFTRDETSTAPKALRPVPTVIQRRADTAKTLYGTALDLSGGESAHIKSIKQEGSLEAGYGVLTIETVNGTDTCFTSYRGGQMHKVAGIETDATQAFVQTENKAATALYLGGGTVLKTAFGTITRSESGLAFIEKLPDGTYAVGNPSPTKAIVTVTLPALGGEKKFDLVAGETKAIK